MLTDLQKLKFLMDEAEEKTSKEPSKTNDNENGEETSTEVTIYDEQGNQLALTDAYNNCKQELVSILESYNNTIEPLSKSVQKGIITQEEYKLFEEATLKARKDLEHLVTVTYESVYKEMTLMEQKEIEELSEQLQTYISQCVAQIKLCVTEKANVPAAKYDKSQPATSNDKSTTALTNTSNTSLTTTRDKKDDVNVDNYDNDYETTVHKNMDELKRNTEVTETLKDELLRLCNLTAEQTLELYNLRMNQVLKALNYASLPLAIAQDGMENVARAIKKSFTFLSDLVTNIINGIKNAISGKAGDVAKELMDLTPLGLFIKDQGSLLFQLIQIPFKLVFVIPDAWKKTVGKDGKKKQKLEKELRSKMNTIRTDKNLSKEQKEKAIKDLQDEYNDLIKDIDNSNEFGMHHTKSTLNKINVNKSKINNAKSNAEKLNTKRQRSTKKVLNGLKDAINNALS